MEKEHLLADIDRVIQAIDEASEKGQDYYLDYFAADVLQEAKEYIEKH